eukprot:COSAG01_NODE_49728_length_369_cov_1.529630_1_plen_100_part_01
MHLPILRIIAGGKIFGTDTDVEARATELASMSDVELEQEVSRTICEISEMPGDEQGECGGAGCSSPADDPAHGGATVTLPQRRPGVWTHGASMGGAGQGD